MAAITTPRWTYGEAVPRNQIPLLDVDEFRGTLLDQVAAGGRVVAFFGQPAERDAVRLLAILAFADTSTFDPSGSEAWAAVSSCSS